MCRYGEVQFRTDITCERNAQAGGGHAREVDQAVDTAGQAGDGRREIEVDIGFEKPDGLSVSQIAAEGPGCIKILGSGDLCPAWKEDVIEYRRITAGKYRTVADGFECITAHGEKKEVAAGPGIRRRISHAEKMHVFLVELGVARAQQQGIGVVEDVLQAVDTGR